MKIKNINYIVHPGTLPDIYNDSIDVLVSLEDKYCKNGFSYCIEVATPQSLSSLMEKWEVDYLPPAHPYIIIRKLTETVIEKAIRAFVEEKDDAYWLKLYHAATELDINDLNAALNRQIVFVFICDGIRKPYTISKQIVRSKLQLIKSKKMSQLVKIQQIEESVEVVII